MQKKVLIHSIAFSPDGVSTAYLYNDIALGLVENGFEVIVLTTTPHYNRLDEELAKQPLRKRFGGLFYTSSFGSVSVYHVPQKKFKSTALRILGFIYWHILSLILGICQTNLSLILAPSPPLTIGLVSLIIGKLKGAKVIYNVQEIYPDFLINQGNLKSSIIIRMLKFLERVVYNNSNAVTTIDQVFYNTIVSRFKNSSTLHVIPNFVDTEIYKPVSFEGKLDEEFFPNTNKLKIMYAGNIGYAQDWDPLLLVAEQLQDEPVEFWVVGEGVLKNYLIAEVKRRRLTDIHILPYQARHQMPYLIAYADLHFIFMNPDMEGEGFPSKVYTILACKKPLIVITGQDTPLYNFLHPTNCAILINSHDVLEKTAKLRSEIVKIVEKHTDLKLLGENGHRQIESSYSKRAVIKQYVGLITRLIKN